MTSKFGILLMGLAMVSANPAFAHGVKVDMVAEGLTQAVATFKAREPSDVRKSFAGIKGWIEGHGVKVKVYLSGDQAIRYTCTEDEDPSTGKDVFVCVKQ